MVVEGRSLSLVVLVVLGCCLVSIWSLTVFLRSLKRKQNFENLALNSREQNYYSSLVVFQDRFRVSN